MRLRLPWQDERPRSVTSDDPRDPFDDAFQAKLELLSVVSTRLHRGQHRAERRSRRTGAGLEFADHREYVPGDDVRHVDWAAYERLDRLLVRVHEEEEDLAVHVLLDVSASMAMHGKLEQGKRLAAAVIHVALGRLDRASLSTLTDTASPRLGLVRGRGQSLRALSTLRQVRAGGATHLERATRSFVAQTRARGVVVLVSDLLDARGFAAALDVLRYARFEVTVLLVFAPEDVRPAASGDVRLVDAETGEIRDVTVTRAWLAKLEAKERARLQHIAGVCREKHVGHAAVSTEAPFDRAVLELLRRGGLFA